MPTGNNKTAGKRVSLKLKRKPTGKANSTVKKSSESYEVQYCEQVEDIGDYQTYSVASVLEEQSALEHMAIQARAPVAIGDSHIHHNGGGRRTVALWKKLFCCSPARL